MTQVTERLETLYKQKSQRFLTLEYAYAGYPFNHKGNAGRLLLRKPGKLTYACKGSKDYAGRSITDSYTVKAEADLVDTRLSGIRNIDLLSRSYHQLRMQNAQQECFQFTNNGGTIGTPTGSALVGMTWGFTISDVERRLTAYWETMLFDTEFRWMVERFNDNIEEGPTNFEQVKYARPGIIEVLLNDTQLKEIHKPKVSIKTTAQGDRKDYRNRPIPRFLEIHAEVVVDNVTAVGVNLAKGSKLERFAFEFKTANGENIKLVFGYNAVNVEWLSEDENALGKIVIKEYVSLTQQDTYSSIVDIGDYTANEFLICELPRR